MKILVYETREDELDAIRKLEKELPIEIRITAEIHPDNRRNPFSGKCIYGKRI